MDCTIRTLQFWIRELCVSCNLHLEELHEAPFFKSYFSIKMHLKKYSKSFRFILIHKFVHNQHGIPLGKSNRQYPVSRQ